MSESLEDRLQKKIEKIAGDDPAVLEYNQKKRALQRHEIDVEYDRLQEQQKNLETLKSFNLEAEDPEYLKDLIKETDDYLLNAKKAKIFLTNDFKGKVTFFPKNIILIGAETGVGKSTITANVAHQSALQAQKILIITNEETESDVYNRLTCLNNNVPYNNHENFTDAQREEFKRMIPVWNGRVKVVGNTRKGLNGLTTTIEGIENLLNSTLVNKNTFDLIIIDYYQNIDRSEKNDKMNSNEVQYRFCKFLDQFKNVSSATIVVMAQLKTTSEDLPFKEALEGRRGIVNTATCVLRVNKDPENSRTSFQIIKSRFAASQGETIHVGFDKGKYVLYDQEFKIKAQERANKLTQAKLLELCMKGSSEK